MPTLPMSNDPWLLYEFSARLQMDLEDDWRLQWLQAAEFEVSLNPLDEGQVSTEHYGMEFLTQLQSTEKLSPGDTVMTRGRTKTQSRSGTFVLP